MTYKLKKGIENFDVVDGAFAGRKFVRGKVYGEVPPEEKGKFEKIKPLTVNRSPLKAVDRSPSTVHRKDTDNK